MQITLPADIQKSLEAQVAAGHFASVEEAVRFAVSHFAPADEDDSWVQPYLDEAREAVARGEVISLEEFNKHVDEKLAELDKE